MKFLPKLLVAWQYSLVVIICYGVNFNTLQAQNAFIAVTTAGGAYNAGTIYRFNVDGTGYQKIIDLPVGTKFTNGLVQSPNGYLYSSAYIDYGGQSGVNDGHIYRIKSDGSGYSTLVSFDYTNEFTTGADPYGELLLLNGRLYGENSLKGPSPNPNGTLFSLDTTGFNFNAFKSFSSNDPVTGSGPGFGFVAGTDGFLYGVMMDVPGSVFKVKTDGTSFQTLHKFLFPSETGPSGSPFNQLFPQSLVFGSDGKLYGTYYNRDYNQGILYSLNPDGSAFTVIHQFDGVAESNTPAGLMLSSTGDLYGTTKSKGSNNNGTIFKISSGVYSKVYDFPSGWGQPFSKLVEIGSALWGTGIYGGVYGKGVVFKYDLTINDAIKVIDVKNQNGTKSSILTPITVDPLMLNVPSNIRFPNPPNPIPITNSSFKILWNRVYGATSYIVDVSSSSDFSVIEPTYNNFILTDTVYQFNNLKPGTNYYVRIKSSNGVTTSRYSSVFAVPTSSGAPTASQASNLVYDSFTANWNVCSGAIAYYVDVATDATFTKFLPGYSNKLINGATTNSLTVDVPCPGTYYYRVRSFSSINTWAIYSPNSNVVSVTTPFFGAPKSLFATNISFAECVANWTKVQAATSYFLDVSDVIDFSTLLPGYNNLNVAGTNQAITGLQNNTNYYFRVRAFDGVNISPTSAAVSVTTILTAPQPLPVTNLSATGCTINWMPVPGATGYQIDVSNSSSYDTYISVGNATSFVVSGLSPNHSYSVRIRATGGVFMSVNSAFINIATNSTTKSGQTITFDQLPTTSTYGGSLNLSAVASSGLAIAYTSSNPAIAAISFSGGNQIVTFKDLGPVTITASQTGNGTYNPAPSISQALAVTASDQAITFDALAAKKVGDTPFTLGAKSSSGLPVTYESSNPSVATIYDGVVTIVGGGTTTITARQSGDDAGNFNEAPSVLQQLVVENGVNFILDKVSGTKNTEVLVPVKVSGFTNIISSQFSLHWDPAVVTFVGTESFGFNSIDVASFGTSQVASGQLTFSWFDPGVAGQSLPDNSTLFNIRFKLSGNYGAQTPVTINGQPLAIEVIDNNFNNVTAGIQAGTVSIDAAMTINGKIHYPNIDPVQSVTVILTGGAPQSSLTDNTGSYQFITNAGSNYTITPVKTNDPNRLNGIDVQDVAFIRRHILDVEPFSTPYQIIAADVNQSNTISTLDIVYIQALILGINNDFPNNNQWTFVPGNYVFPNPNNSFPYPQAVALAQVDGQVTQDFVAVKFGDVNNSRDNSQQDRQGATSELIFVIEAGKTVENTIEIPIRVRNFEQISAYQFSLAWDTEKLEYVKVINQSTDGHFGEIFAREGVLTTLWDEESGKSRSLNYEADLFTVQFRKKTTDASNQDIDITSEKTNVAVYNDNLKSVNYRIDKTQSQEPTTEFELYQNFPNAFDEKTQIGFAIPQQGELVLEILEVTGRPVKRIQSIYDAGKHFVEWDGLDSTNGKTAGGLYICRAQFGNVTKAMKMVKIK